MIRQKLKFQVVFYCAGSNIPADQVNIQKCLPLFMPLGYFPSHIQEIDATTMGAATRLALQSPTTGTTVGFLSNRIDITRQVGAIGASNLGDLDNFIEDAKSIITILNNEYGLTGTRIALITDYTINPNNEEKIHIIRKKLLPENFNTIDGETFEWNFRAVNKGPIGEGCGETINSIVIINKSLFQIPTPEGVEYFDGLQLSIDLNTIPMNTEARLNPENVEIFLNAAFSKHEQLLAKVEEFVNV